MKSAFVVAGSLLAACATDPTLHVTVVNPSGLAIASSKVSVYESAKFGCVDVEYGNVDSLELQAALVTEAVVDARGAAHGLSGMSRTGKKVIVARAFDASTTPQLVAAGCVEKGLVSGADQVSVATEVSATVSFALADASGGDFYGINVTATDPNGRLLDGRPVWWRVFGPKGAQPAPAAGALTAIGDGVWEPVKPTCSTNGIVTVHPVPPKRIGGFASQIRVAWAVDPPPFLTAFTKADFRIGTQLTPPNGGTKFCALHSSPSLHRVACLDGGAGAAIDYEATVAAGSATLVAKDQQAIPSDAVAIYSVDSAGNKDVYALTTRCAVVGPLFGASTATTPLCAGADDVLVVPACGSAAAKLLVHIPASAGKDGVKQLDVHGNALAQADFPLAYKAGENAVELVGAGCVTELDPASGAPALRQAIAIQYTQRMTGSLATRLSYTCAAGNCAPIELTLPGAGVSFTGDSDAELITATVDATGVVMTQFVLVAGGNGDRLIERSRQPAASIPNKIVVANFEDGSGLDTMWDVSARRGAAFELAYPSTIGTQPLIALSQAQPIAVEAMLAGDVTGDGFDDVVITAAPGDLSAPKRGVIVIPSHVDAQVVPAKADATCEP